MRLRIGAGLTALVAAIVVNSGYGNAENGYWEPPKIHPSALSLESVLAKVASAEGALGKGRNERYEVTADGLRFDATATILGDDFVVHSTLDGATYASDAATVRIGARRPRASCTLWKATSKATTSIVGPRGGSHSRKHACLRARRAALRGPSGCC